MMLPKMPQAVIFDMDGVLIDSEKHYREAFLAASREDGFELPADLYKRLCGNPWDIIKKTIIGEKGADFPMERFGDAWVRHLAIQLDGGVDLKPGVVEMLDLLDELKLPRAVATSSQRASVNRHLGPFDLIPRFDHIVAREDYSDAKPSPIPYLTAAERLGIDPAACLALEDSYPGIQSASSAGMMTVMVPDMAPATDETRERCAATCRHMMEVAALLRATYGNGFGAA